MAKQLVVRKSFLESYYDNMIEKSTTHKYIRRVPKSTGKGYNYFYPEDFKKPMKALLSFFGMKQDTIDKAYTNNNIQQSYGASKQSFFLSTSILCCCLSCSAISFVVIAP